MTKYWIPLLIENMLKNWFKRAIFASKILLSPTTKFSLSHFSRAVVFFLLQALLWLSSSSSFYLFSDHLILLLSSSSQANTCGRFSSNPCVATTARGVSSMGEVNNRLRRNQGMRILRATKSRERRRQIIKQRKKWKTKGASTVKKKPRPTGS